MAPKTAMRSAMRKLEYHGQTRKGPNGVQQRTPEYGIYRAMINRCHLETDRGYRWYGARGIRVCERWRESFSAFLHDMGPRPAGLTLERSNNDGNYEPANCRWASRRDQRRNTRGRLRMLTVNGETHCATEWAERMGIQPATLYARLRKGWSVARAVTAPLRGSS